jgi:predicted ArsR family transcriptional regulator
MEEKMRYQETGELHMDFHGAVNTTIDYIVEHFGEEALAEIFNRVGKDVYKSIHDGLMQDDPAELKAHLAYFFNREEGEFELQDNAEGFVLQVKKCPAVAHVCKLGLHLSPYFCRQTIDVNNALCDGTPWQCETVVLGHGCCRQSFIRRRQS